MLCNLVISLSSHCNTLRYLNGRLKIDWIQTMEKITLNVAATQTKSTTTQHTDRTNDQKGQHNSTTKQLYQHQQQK